MRPLVEGVIPAAVMTLVLFFLPVILYNVQAIVATKKLLNCFHMRRKGVPPSPPADFQGSPIPLRSLGLKLEVPPAYYRDDQGPERP